MASQTLLSCISEIREDEAPDALNECIERIGNHADRWRMTYSPEALAFTREILERLLETQAHMTRRAVAYGHALHERRERDAREEAEADETSFLPVAAWIVGTTDMESAA